MKSAHGEDNPLESTLAALQSGELDLPQAAAQIRGAFFQDLGHSTLDTDRSRRTGAAEVVYGQWKTPQQIADLVSALLKSGQNALVTRASAQAYAQVRASEPDAQYHESAAAITVNRTRPASAGTTIAVITAGTSDLPVAEEAAVTAEFYGNPVHRVCDVGVAGIHRLLARLDEIRAARVLIVVAGMEGALPSVVAGLVDKPVIAVPTSVGYGAAFAGATALLAMLSSCASGLAVVNIDNGFGAGYLANTINRL